MDSTKNFLSALGNKYDDRFKQTEGMLKSMNPVDFTPVGDIRDIADPEQPWWVKALSGAGLIASIMPPVKAGISGVKNVAKSGMKFSVASGDMRDALRGTERFEPIKAVKNRQHETLRIIHGSGGRLTKKDADFVNGYMKNPKFFEEYRYQLDDVGDATEAFDRTLHQYNLGELD